MFYIFGSKSSSEGSSKSFWETNVTVLIALSSLLCI